MVQSSFPGHRLCGAAVAGLLLFLGAPLVLFGNERPNILFCFADDWGWPHAGAYGDPLVETPTFDRLGREGVLFEHAYVSSPSCTPSRNAVLTGQQFYRLDEGANLHSTLKVEHPNFMKILRDAGYETGHWRKAWGPGSYGSGGYEEHPMGPETDFATFLRQRTDGKPFTFWFGTSDPHRVYERGSGEASGMNLANVHVPAFLPDAEEIRSDIADYYFEIQRWDSDVARALALLEEAGELEHTIIVMSGDHGMPFPRAKGNLYDWGARVPLAIRWGAELEPGRHVTDFVSLTDLAPTFLEIAGLDVPAPMTGRSLLPLLESKKSGRIDPSRDHVVAGRERHVPAQELPSEEGYPSRSIRNDRFLFIMNLEPERWPAGVPANSTHPMGSFADCDDGPTKSFIRDRGREPDFRRFFELCFARRPAEELYDVEADPYQVNNLAGDPRYEETAEKLRWQLVAYLQHTEDPRFSDAAVEFDDYPYRAGYHREALEKWRQQQPARDAK